MIKPTEQYIVDILTNQMQFDEQNIWIRDENRKIPPNKDIMFCIVGFVDGPVIGNVTSNESVDLTPPSPAEPYTAMTEVQQIVSRENIQIDILSRDATARFRRWEVMGALNSTYSKQVQELNNFKIFRKPVSQLNTSNAEGGSQINRFSITVACHVWYRKETILTSPLGDFYDDFTQRVDDEETISTPNGIIEFEITPSTPDPSGE